MSRIGVWMSYIELPALDVLACVFICDDDDELGDLAADHPLIELGHDLLDVGLYLVIGRDLFGSAETGRVGYRGSCT